MDKAFEESNSIPSPKLECNSIFQLAFHVMSQNIATIVPSGFSTKNNAFPNTREIPLTEPIVRKPVGLVWKKTEPPFPIPQPSAPTRPREDLLGVSLGQASSRQMQPWPTAAAPLRLER